jgi:DNA polymerase I-like protein with 3'-5' exonuclease and polymerase domains
VRNKDVKMLKAGTEAPIHTRYGFAATTRTTSSAPNLQNFRRAKGIRECLMPRPGCVFLASDYPGLESFTLAQVCVWKLGRRQMLDSLNAGRDLHAEVGAGILGITYDEIQARRGAGDKMAKNARDCGKYGNFGLTGYMTNPATFALYVNLGSRTDENPRGLRWTPKQAAEVMSSWRKSAHDQVAFLAYVDTLKNAIGKYDVEIPGTSIIRRGCTRTAAANTHFQGLGATVARRAGWLLAKAQYIEYTPAEPFCSCTMNSLPRCPKAR